MDEVWNHAAYRDCIFFICVTNGCSAYNDEELQSVNFSKFAQSLTQMKLWIGTLLNKSIHI